MDPFLISLLGVVILINLQSFYFGFYRKTQLSLSLQKASFVITGILLIPFLVYALFSQAGSEQRLANFGIPIHPDFAYTIGIRNGYGDNPTWVYALKKDAKDVLSFYESSKLDPTWKLKEINPLYLLYVTDTKRIMIAHSRRYGRESVIITVSDKN